MTAASETIVAAALHWGGVTVSMARPARHHDVIHAVQRDVAGAAAHMARQGFLTSAGRIQPKGDGTVKAAAVDQDGYEREWAIAATEALARLACGLRARAAMMEREQTQETTR